MRKLLVPAAAAALLATSALTFAAAPQHATGTIKAYDAKAQTGRYDLQKLDMTLGQAPLMSPSVFNFFSPTYAPPGEIRDRSLFAPELEIATEYLLTTTQNLFFDQVIYKNTTKPFGQGVIVLDVNEEAAVADNADALVALLAQKLLGRPMSPALETEVRATIARYPASNRGARVSEALFLVSISPDFAVQR